MRGNLSCLTLSARLSGVVVVTLRAAVTPVRAWGKPTGTPATPPIPPKLPQPRHGRTHTGLTPARPRSLPGRAPAAASPPPPVPPPPQRGSLGHVPPRRAGAAPCEGGGPATPGAACCPAPPRRRRPAATAGRCLGRSSPWAAPAPAPPPGQLLPGRARSLRSPTSPQARRGREPGQKPARPPARRRPAAPLPRGRQGRCSRPPLPGPGPGPAIPTAAGTQPLSNGRGHAPVPSRPPAPGVRAPAPAPPGGVRASAPRRRCRSPGRRGLHRPRYWRPPQCLGGLSRRAGVRRPLRRGRSGAGERERRGGGVLASRRSPGAPLLAEGPCGLAATAAASPARRPWQPGEAAAVAAGPGAKAGSRVQGPGSALAGLRGLGLPRPLALWPLRWWLWDPV